MQHCEHIIARGDMQNDGKYMQMYAVAAIYFNYGKSFLSGPYVIVEHYTL